jgi:hypothetical protein
MNVARPEPTPTKPLDPVAQQIATVLDETEPVPLTYIRRIVQTVGPERVLTKGAGVGSPDGKTSIPGRSDR